MRVVVLGRNGMVGHELVRSLLPLGTVVGLDRNEADLSKPASLGEVIERLDPDVIVNAAAYTEVDRAESDYDTAQRVNGEAVRELAAIAARRKALLVHFSTDYVFNGTKASPWTEDDSTDPVSAYGRSKLEGEQALAASAADWLCLRTSWVYASRGKNFVRTILRLAEERDELRVIDDQSGVPTSARNIADVTAHVVGTAIQERKNGRFVSSILHYAPAGTTTWHGVATEVLRAAPEILLNRCFRATRVLPIVTREFPTAARRPANSCLSTERIRQRFHVTPPDWRMPLRQCLEDMKRD